MTAAVADMIEYQAEATVEIAAPPKAVWDAVTDLGRRPMVKAFEFLQGEWPEELAQARTVMDRGERDMVRTETVIRARPGEQLLLKIDAPEWGALAWLDHRISPSSGGSRLKFSVIVTMAPTEPAPANRAELTEATERALAHVAAEYRTVVESAP